jgi:hypothetical protein
VALASIHRLYNRQEEWEEAFNDRDFTQVQETIVSHR